MEKPVARDTIVLNHLPTSPHFNKLYKTAKPILKPQPGYNYIYRSIAAVLNTRMSMEMYWCADRLMENRHDHDGSGFVFMDEMNLLVCPVILPVSEEHLTQLKEQKIGNCFRISGMEKISCNMNFELPDGEYLVEFYFIEPWLGIGGGIDASGMRLFDVAINGKTIWNDLDIWKEAGTNTAFKKTVNVQSTRRQAEIFRFPKVNAGQALISAIAIASMEKEYLYRIQQ